MKLLVTITAAYLFASLTFAVAFPATTADSIGIAGSSLEDDVELLTNLEQPGNKGATEQDGNTKIQEPTKRLDIGVKNSTQMEPKGEFGVNSNNEEKEPVNSTIGISLGDKEEAKNTANTPIDLYDLCELNFGRELEQVMSGLHPIWSASQFGWLSKYATFLYLGLRIKWTRYVTPILDAMALKINDGVAASLQSLQQIHTDLSIRYHYYWQLFIVLIIFFWTVRMLTGRFWFMKRTVQGDATTQAGMDPKYLENMIKRINWMCERTSTAMEKKYRSDSNEHEMDGGHALHEISTMNKDLNEMKEHLANLNTQLSHLANYSYLSTLVVRGLRKDYQRLQDASLGEEVASESDEFAVDGYVLNSESKQWVVQNVATNFPKLATQSGDEGCTNVSRGGQPVTDAMQYTPLNQPPHADTFLQKSYQTPQSSMQPMHNEFYGNLPHHAEAYKGEAHTNAHTTEIYASFPSSQSAGYGVAIDEEYHRQERVNNVTSVKPTPPIPSVPIHDDKHEDARDVVMHSTPMLRMNQPKVEATADSYTLATSLIAGDTKDASNLRSHNLRSDASTPTLPQRPNTLNFQPSLITDTLFDEKPANPIRTARMPLNRREYTQIEAPTDPFSSNNVL